MGYLSPIIVLDLVAGSLAIVLVVANKLFAEYEDVTVDVNDGEEEFVVEGGVTLLQAFTQNEIYIPSACGGQGSCGFCTAKVKEGGGPVLPTEEPMLTRDQLIDDVRLSCQVKVREDMEVQIEEKYLEVEKYSAVVESTRDVTPSIKEIVFDLKEPETIDFKAGQYVQVQVPVDGDTVDRAYSIASEESVHDKVMLTVQLIEGGLGSTYLHELEEGEEVEFTGPFGDFYIQDTDATIIGVAGGVGLAPLRSIVFSLLEKGVDKEIWLFYGSRTMEDLYYHEDLQELADEHDNFHYVPALDSSQPEWEGEVGLITEVMKDYLDKGDDMEGYLCGPPPMMDATIDLLTEYGIDEEDILYDDFS
ncbi:2Fe-2S iron-sulfur cluster binding domain-containing protein [Candidatus Bipolaricaulota bacterium]|nr:2Fe-2S iron-sulfur cluster binding domain-containing protein [Candidatus Bipolaricaulota bacterium]